jgi:tRNA dimethylallyltransferase
MNDKVKLLVVAGPTACGKSDLAVEIAESVKSDFEKIKSVSPEIINFDSVQFFDRVEIGAAKPNADLLRRVKHHFIGHVPALAEYTAGEFRRDALKLIESAGQRAVTSYLCVGGSGFYMQALEKGMFDVPASRPETRSELEAHIENHGSTALHEELVKRDPSAGAKIHVNDHYRIVRALEVLRHSDDGLSLSEIRANQLISNESETFTFNKIGLFRNRDSLRQKVTLRVREMMAAGFIDEVKSLRGEGLTAWSPLNSVGYKEVQAFLDGKLSKDQLEQAIVTSTMQLAKRQMTWFRRDPEITWFDADENWTAAVEFGRKFLTLGQ